MQWKNNLSSSRFNKIVAQFPRRKILIFGDVGIDKYTLGKVSRISPEAPIPILEVTGTVLKLGLAANVADNISALGGKAILVGILGQDADSKAFTSLTRDRKINSRYLVHDASRKTTMKERVVAEAQQVVRIDHETAHKPNVKLIQQVWKKLEKALAEADAVIIEDYAKGVVDAAICDLLIRKATARKIPIFVDPSRHSPASLYTGCTIITPNASEAEVLTGIKISDAMTLRQAGHRLLDLVNGELAIITLGKDGMAVFSRGQTEPITIPTFAREVYDVSGAGDTAIATLALALVSGADVIESVLLANYASGVVVGKRGTATTSIPELRAYIDMVRSMARKH